jgi:hypothetical protein
MLQKLTEFEDQTGIQFTHIRLLARAFTDRSVGMLQRYREIAPLFRVASAKQVL